MVSWAILLVFDRWIEHRRTLLIACSCILLLAAFAMQEAFLLAFSQEATPKVLLTASTILFSAGYALYGRLWLLVYEQKPLQRTLVCLLGSSALSAVVACLPPLVVGFDETGSIVAFALRLAVIGASFWCLLQELKTQEAAAEPSAKPNTAPSPKEAWNTIKFVIVAVLASRIVQGLLVLNETGYRDYGAHILLVASPLVSASIILLTKRYGSRSSYLSSLYWSIATCSLVVLLVVASVSDSSIGFLWVLLFAVYAQIDVVFMGILASLRPVFGTSFSRLACVLFCAKDGAFALGRIMQDQVDVSLGCLICVVVLLGTTVFEIVVYLAQSFNNTHEQGEPSSIPEALSASIGARYQLTPRESDVLFALLQGRSYTNIGHKLFISKSTVKTHANHIYAKLGVNTRDELIELLEPGNPQRQT
ncbi:helix-turn-helix transcriptional regulator [Eggerthella sinensis]|uniref:helix-turn-helix transcriptional regulator n=1 Tax=Eggerthella sinensis TaxID=242230 RepID=UPI0022E02E16|nr:helix-turn-helix transcriptional regulator [Eggerthella sinensis]